jgi:putative oxidoreductase
MNALLNKVRSVHDAVFGLTTYLQSPLLLAVRLYWGWQLAQSGWGKLHNLQRVTEFFASLNLPAPAQTAVFISCLEFFGGILLALGLFSRIISLMLTVNLIVAYVTADREAMFAIFSDPDKFMAATPFTFLCASLVVLIFGAGKFSVDTAAGYLLGGGKAKQAQGSTQAIP